MQSSHHLTSTTRTATLRRRHGRSAGVGILVAASLGVAACGTAGPGVHASAAHILNTTKIELAIKQSSLQQRGRHVRVTCPTTVEQKQGFVFYCTAYYHKSTTPFAVSELNSAGDVHYVAR